MRLRLLVLALVLLFVPTPALAAVAARPIKIMPLGDSITWGVGSTTTSSYRAALWNRLVNQAGYAVDFVGSQQSGSLPDTDNEGHSGWRIDEIAANVNGWLATYQPDVVLLHIGTNDMNQNYQVDTAPQRLGALIDQILAARPSATVLVAKIVPSLDATIQARINAFNATVPAVARGSRVKLVDLSVLSAADLNDTLHPNDTGYARMAVRWYSALEAVLGDGRDWPLLTNGFETADPAPTWRDTAGAAINVGGYCCGLTTAESSPRTEGVAHSGASALMYSGSDNSATQSYAYQKIFAADLPVTARSVLSYWIYPQTATGTFVAVDLQFTDGSALRDSGAVDQFGIRAHPQYQGEGGHLVLNQWNLVRVNLGGVAGLAGKTISRVDVGFDRPTGTGPFRGYVDDLSVADEGGAYSGVDLALNRPVTGSAACAGAEAPAKAVDGLVLGNAKWCSGVAGAVLQVDLGASRTIRRFVLRHASAGGETLAWNTRAYTIRVSPDAVTWTTLVTVTGNADGVTTHVVTPTAARYAQLTITAATQSSDQVTRLYEFEVDGGI
jgi:lysophospholipase L1-like esterase